MSNFSIEQQSINNKFKKETLTLSVLVSFNLNQELSQQALMLIFANN